MTETKPDMRALDFLLMLRDEAHCCPQSAEGAQLGLPSNGEIRRWLRNGSVLINGQRPGPGDSISFPVDELVFFPDSNKRTTVR